MWALVVIVFWEKGSRIYISKRHHKRGIENFYPNEKWYWFTIPLSILSFLFSPFHPRRSHLNPWDPFLFLVLKGTSSFTVSARQGLESRRQSCRLWHTRYIAFFLSPYVVSKFSVWSIARRSAFSSPISLLLLFSGGWRIVDSTVRNKVYCFV